MSIFLEQRTDKILAFLALQLPVIKCRKSENYQTVVLIRLNLTHMFVTNEKLPNRQNLLKV